MTRKHQKSSKGNGNLRVSLKELKDRQKRPPAKLTRQASRVAQLFIDISSINTCYILQKQVLMFPGKIGYGGLHRAAAADRLNQERQYEIC